MPVDSNAAVQQIDEVLKEGKALRSAPHQLNSTAFNHIVSLYAATVDRTAPSGSQYIKEKESTRGKYTPQQLLDYPGLRRDVIESLSRTAKVFSHRPASC